MNEWERLREELAILHLQLEKRSLYNADQILSKIFTPEQIAELKAGGKVRVETNQRFLSKEIQKKVI